MKSLKLQPLLSKSYTIHFVEKNKENYSLIASINNKAAIIDTKFWILGADYDAMIANYNSGICQNCKSTNTKRHPLDNSLFWGCYECGYGFWESYLTDNLRLKFYQQNGMLKELERLKNLLVAIKEAAAQKVDIYTRRKNNFEEAIQLSLF